MVAMVFPKKRHFLTRRLSVEGDHSPRDRVLEFKVQSKGKYVFTVVTYLFSTGNKGITDKRWFEGLKIFWAFVSLKISI